MTKHLDASLPIDERVDLLLAQMTLEEKIGQMLQLDAREGLRDVIDRFKVGSVLHTAPEQLAKVDKYVSATRLRIPLLVADDAIHGHSFWEGATIYPTQLGMACSWDVALIEKGAKQAAAEISATGIHWTFSPVLCIARDLRWGRVGETFGEDPHLIGELSSAMVRGYQGDGLKDENAVLATAKHFAGYSETQGGRDASEADLSPRKLRSWFLPPFEKVAREGCKTFMLGYQSIDGVPITSNSWLINDVLKGEWGFEGILVTDWDNVGRMVWEQKTSPDFVHAAALAVKSGNDLIMTTWQFYEAAKEAVEVGLLSETDIDPAVRRILRLKFELGLFENPRLPNPARQAEIIGCDEHTQTNLQLARKSIVLLENKGILPITITAANRTIAVIGPNADDAQNQLGDWAGNSGQINWMPEGHPRHKIKTVLDGIKSLVAPNVKVTYGQGCRIADLVDAPEGAILIDGQPRPKLVVPADTEPKLLGQALEIAADSDLIVAVVGDCIPLAGELRSTATLELVGGQIEMLNELSKLGKPMIVVVISTKPLILPTSALSAAAVIQAFSPGMEGGTAIAEIIFGLTIPSGKLPLSIPRHVGQQPIYYNQIRGQHGDTYADLTQSPQYPFGFGLSYSEVEYSDVRTDEVNYKLGEDVTISVKVENLGAYEVEETVQVYICDEVTSVTWAGRELKGFKKVRLQPGESRDVSITLQTSSFTIVSASGLRVVEEGLFTAYVGPSSSLADLNPVQFSIKL